jgi:hypothetical protein
MPKKFDLITELQNMAAARYRASRAETEGGKAACLAAAIRVRDAIVIFRPSDADAWKAECVLKRWAERAEGNAAWYALPENRKREKCPLVTKEGALIAREAHRLACTLYARLIVVREERKAAALALLETV